ncbi:adenylosuccinate lyase [Galbibacter marinus]|uniref:Adenylosuccinate lyase n=1 Tax=Galbibacter marinus TaxID=555500 RepID=K2PUW1_9FLAO|nr:hypothetical protein [Galbibacter marinus]EKF56465.1 adenylosuccinate lyase [Galbibacter marinus]
MEFKSQIQSLKAYKADRQYLADKVLQNKELFPILMDYSLCNDSSIGKPSCWVLEYVCIAKLPWIHPYLKRFIKQLPLIENKSSKRCCARICMQLCQSYFLDKDISTIEAIDKSDLESLIEVNFDWLINNEKVATKAYAMETLYHLGKAFIWVHPELKAILQKGIPNHTMAYTARARHILNKI